MFLKKTGNTFPPFLVDFSVSKENTHVYAQETMAQSKRRPTGTHPQIDLNPESGCVSYVRTCVTRFGLFVQFCAQHRKRTESLRVPVWVRN